MTRNERIGGEFEIKASDFSLKGSDIAWPTYSAKRNIKCNFGRSALSLILSDWRDKFPGADIVWLPDYICSSVSDTVVNNNYRVRWYHNKPGDIKLSIPPTPVDNDLILFVHYFGWRNLVLDNWIKKFPSRTWGVIEDCVQSSYSEGVGVLGDYVITSMRKWWVVPDGAQVHSTREIVVPEIAKSDEEFISKRVAAKFLRGESSDEEKYLNWIKDTETSISENSVRDCSWLSNYLLSGVDFMDFRKRRCDNWSVLMQGLGMFPEISVIYDRIDGVIPLNFPVIVNDICRDDLRNFLSKNNVFCPIHWSSNGEWSESSIVMSNKILAFPLDQRYESHDMEHIINVIKRYFDGLK